MGLGSICAELYASEGIYEGAGGGGLSTLWPWPSYQHGVWTMYSLGDPCFDSGVDVGCRMVPDVSADADVNTGYTTYFDGQWQAVGGTQRGHPPLGRDLRSRRPGMLNNRGDGQPGAVCTGDQWIVGVQRRAWGRRERLHTDERVLRGLLLRDDIGVRPGDRLGKPERRQPAPGVRRGARAAPTRLLLPPLLPRVLLGGTTSPGPTVGSLSSRPGSRPASTARSRDWV